MRERERHARSIPTDEDFAKAHTAMDRRLRIFAEVRDSVFEMLPDAPLHELYLFGEPGEEVFARVFFETESDIQVCNKCGVSKHVHDAILKGFQKREDSLNTTLTTEYDSHENVQKKCNGDYFKYLK